MAAETGDRELIVDVSRDIVASIAPEESVLFQPLSVAYFERPDSLSRSSKEDMLGFGLGEAIVPLTPVALAVVSEILVYLRGELAKTVAHDAATALDAKLKALFHRFHQGAQPDAAVPALSGEQLAEVRRLAFEKACTLRIPEARASLLADAVVGSLVLSS